MFKSLRPNQTTDLTECLEQSFKKYLEGSMPNDFDDGIDSDTSESSAASCMQSSTTTKSQIEYEDENLTDTLNTSSLNTDTTTSTNYSSTNFLSLSKNRRNTSKSTSSEIKSETIKAKVKTKNSRNKFTFRAYHPDRFKSIREALGIVERDFIKSVSKLKPVNTFGSSKSVFWLTGDSKCFIKSIGRTEFKNLRHMFGGYINRIGNDSLLSQHLGVYRLKFEKYDLRLVVLSNITPSSSISLKFDIKGSTNGTRRIKVGESVLKDLDVRDDYFPGFKISKISLDYVRKALDLDTEFLASHNIMDYSLFVAVEDLKVENSLENKNSNKNDGIENSSVKSAEAKYGEAFYLDAVNLKTGTPCVVFLGVIDILVKYGLRKKAEHSIRSIYENSKEISIVTPTFYRTRLLEFFDNMFIDEETWQKETRQSLVANDAETKLD